MSRRISEAELDAIKLSLRFTALNDQQSNFVPVEMMTQLALELDSIVCVWFDDGKRVVI